VEISPVPTTSAAAPAKDPQSLVLPQRRSAIWLLVWLGLALWAANGLATAWPYELHPLLLVLIIALPGVVFRAADILLMRWHRHRLAGWRRAAGRLAALPLGALFAFVLFAQLAPISMARFERALAPWVAQVAAAVETEAVCPADGRYPVDAALNAYLAQSRGLRTVNLHRGGGRFVIELAGRSIDIDGSTLYYDSATRTWQRFHNDNRDKADAFAALVKPLAQCRFVLS
jgi:hypothetical protein